MIRNLASLLAELLFGLAPAPRCALCGHKARGWRSLDTHLDRAHPGHDHAWSTR
jgi:hypothetical protein